jgi:transposase
LKAQVKDLRRAQFGQSSERLNEQIEDVEQLIDELAENHAASTACCQAILGAVCDKKNSAPMKQQAVRKPLPDHLPHERIEHQAPSVCTSCGSARLTCIGVDERKVLEIVSAHFKVIVHARPRIGCRDCETIMQAPLPNLPIERGMLGPGLLTHVAVSKYCYHLPLNRQSEMYENLGVQRSTIADWIGRMEFLLKLLADEIGRHVREGTSIHADDVFVVMG